LVSTIRAARFHQLANGSAAVRDLITQYTEVLWAEAQQSAACNAVHDAPARLCRWLLQCADRSASEILPLTHEFLAQMLGVQRTTVTLLAQAMQKKGQIKYSRGRIIILDREAIGACACECYHVVHTGQLPATLGIKL
jgi:CRP-like cAMP-binding protein